MADTNLSLVLHGIKDLRLEERPIPEPGRHEVQISIRSVGLCGSDVSYWQKGRIGNLVVTKPMVLGHEPSGVVSKLGSGVTNVRVGDRVAVEPNRPCGTCCYCKRGRYNICSDLHYLATPPQDGCITRYFCHPATFVYKLPDNVNFDEGALVQPLALGFYACERGGLKVGDYLLVTGAAGTVVQVGLGGATTQIPLTMVTLKELNIAGSSRFANNYEKVLEAISTGRLNVRQLVTHRFPIEQALQAYTATLNREGAKVIIDCSRQQPDNHQSD
ncbi:sorbitol dehydrogenase [Elysia marginata]|uniref:Sorbitol dehydrogenase n=1 Tax=Elysia marginata TaxID=1093978 RepID=A0AAV4G8X8_9GAST|nr:sorbitol dehydrogenase [Elysia marginata]